jgi:type II secretory pathway pseudopilin PulG
MARSKKRLWGFDDGEREILVAATAAVPGLRGVVERAGQRAELQGLWVVEASIDELDEMYSLVESLMDGTRSRRRLEQLEGMRATVCTSIDGF